MKHLVITMKNVFLHMCGLLSVYMQQKFAFLLCELAYLMHPISDGA